MYIYSLSSSSRYGNAYVLWEGSKKPLLIDCGLSFRRLCRGLSEIGLNPNDLAGVFITHEHSDHIQAMCLKTPFPQKFQIPVFASSGFWNWYNDRHANRIDPSLIHYIEDGQCIDISSYKVQAFLKPHDANEPMGYRIDGTSSSAGFVMDLGHVPLSIENALQQVEYLVFEANYDVNMEINSGRPAFLIERIMGEFGHLSNDQAAHALKRIISPETKQIILTHLSIDCNCPRVAVKTIYSTLKGLEYDFDIKAAPAKGVAGFGLSSGMGQ